MRQWIEDNPEDRRVFGWLVDRNTEAQTGTIKFIAHSIVLTATGEHLDVTMACNEATYPFLHAEMIEAEFDAVAAGNPEIDFVTDEVQFQMFMREHNEHLAGPW